jgi:GAF domain-containing protein
MTPEQPAHHDPTALRLPAGTRGQPAQAGLARDLSELARELQADPSTVSLLERIVHAAVSEVPGAQHAGISEILGRQIVTRAGSDDLVREVDELQYRTGEGPCLTSLHEQITVRCDDLTREERWPQFAPLAVAQGVRSLLSVQLFVADDNLGALNLYADEPGAFSDDDESVAMLLAAHAAVAMKDSYVQTNLRRALETRDVIGQAKGVLMERYKISQGEAFDLLVLASQRTHIKLHDLAEKLAETGELTTD